MTEYPAFICHDCGVALGCPERVREGHESTYHLGTCDVCRAENVAVTEPRDYGHLRPGWEHHVKEPKNVS